MSQPRVLLVEDDYLTGRGCARQLERDGCEVVVAPDARNARSLAATRRWSAAVIDIGLPDGSGVDLAKEMRGSAPELPILLFTGREDRAFANLAQELGAEFLYKPAAPVNIAAFVRRVVDRAAGSHERLRRATSAYGRQFALTEAEHRLLLDAFSGPIWAPIPAASGQPFRRDLGSHSGTPGQEFRHIWAGISELLGTDRVAQLIAV